MKYPQLARALGRWYPDNWDAHGARSDDVLQRALQATSSAELRSIRRELDELRASGICEPQLSDVVRYEMDCYVAPEREGLDMSGWLERVSDAVRRQVQALDAAPIDELFQQAVDALDRGDESALRQLLAQHPRLARERLHAPGTWLREQVGNALDGFFRAPYLLWFVAEDPPRRGRLPSNIAELAQLIVAAARRGGAVQEQVDYALRLVSWSWIARDSGVQIPLIDVLLAAGATPHGNPDNALVNGNIAAAEHLVQRGAEVTLGTAACLERWDDVARLAPHSAPPVLQFALVLAALNGRAEAVARLLGHGADPHEPSRELYAHGTPLHHAVCSGSLETVDVLLAAGASLDAQDSIHHGTPIGWAEYYAEQHAGSERGTRYAEIAAHLKERKSTK